MKTALIVIVALLLVAVTGVFVYGVMQGPQEPRDPGTKTAGDAPDLALFDAESPAITLAALYDLEDTSVTNDRKAGDLLLGAAYNLIRIRQFYFFARVDVTSSSAMAFSEYDYSKSGLNTIKRVQAYTGSVDTYVLRSYYVDQKLQKSGTLEYDFDTEQWIYAVPELTENNVENEKMLTKDKERPYYLYSVLDFPLDFGGLEVMNDGKNEAGRTEDVNYSMVDPDSLKIEYNEEKGYYTVTFDMLLSALNASQETKDRLSGTTTNGKMKNITFKNFTVTMEIWKDAGVFRSLSYKTNVTATLDGKTGDAEIEKSMVFSYDDVNTSVAKKIKDLTPFYNALSDKNKGICDEEVKALSAVKETSAKTETEEDAVAA